MASIVKDTVHDINISRIPSRLHDYEMLVLGAEPMFKLEDRTLEEVCKQHSVDLMNMDINLQECKTIEDVIRKRIEEIEASLYKNLNENHSRALGTTDIKQYIKGDPQYVNAFEILLEVQNVRRQLEAVVEALKNMGWMISHITKLRVAQLEHVTL